MRCPLYLASEPCDDPEDTILFPPHKAEERQLLFAEVSPSQKEADCFRDSLSCL